MIELTTDETLIRTILEDDSVIEGFSDGERVEDLSSALYFHEKGVGIFPVVIREGKASIHAAIPKKNRGKKALEACKNVINTLKTMGYEVIAQVRYNDKKTRCFVNMVGFTSTGSNNNHQLYRHI